LEGESPDVNDFKPKFILRVDGEAVYAHAQNVINVFRDLKLNNLNFVTTTELAP
jgi:biopolymer transport protein ExbD